MPNPPNPMRAQLKPFAESILWRVFRDTQDGIAGTVDESCAAYWPKTAHWLDAKRDARDVIAAVIANYLEPRSERVRPVVAGLCGELTVDKTDGVNDLPPQYREAKQRSRLLPELGAKLLDDVLDVLTDAHYGRPVTVRTRYEPPRPAERPQQESSAPAAKTAARRSTEVSDRGSAEHRHGPRKAASATPETVAPQEQETSPRENVGQRSSVVWFDVPAEPTIQPARQEPAGDPSEAIPEKPEMPTIQWQVQRLTIPAANDKREPQVSKHSGQPSTEKASPLWPSPQEGPPSGSSAEPPGGLAAESRITSLFQATAGWQYRPVAHDEPDAHAESAALLIQGGSDCRACGARVRGKKHKHDGANCDDWFEIAAVGPWTIIAVADGASSRRFSRVGARVACEETVRRLLGSLNPITPDEESITNDARREALLNRIENVVCDATEGAADAVEGAARARKDDRAYRRILGREPQVKDFASTLLVAVHGAVATSDGLWSIGATLQIGDGYAAGIDSDGSLVKVALSANTTFAGEPEYLCGDQKPDKNGLRRHSYSFFTRNLRAMMLMTDGVSDDYAPPNPELLTLYGDLYLNGILAAAHVDTGAAGTSLVERCPQLGPNWEAAVGQWEYHAISERATSPTGADSVKIRNVSAFSQKLGLPLESVSRDPELLAAGLVGDSSWADGNPLAAAPNPETRLEIWLDAYHRSGSFGDRTLVVLEPPSR